MKNQNISIKSENSKKMDRKKEIFLAKNLLSNNTVHQMIDKAFNQEAKIE